MFLEPKKKEIINGCIKAGFIAEHNYADAALLCGIFPYVIFFYNLCKV